MKRLAIRGLPDFPLDAAAAFGAHWLAQARACEEDLLLVFAPAKHTHRDWRRAAVQSLAREAAPCRVNAVASKDEDAVRTAAEYLADAPGITGQYFRLEK